MGIVRRIIRFAVVALLIYGGLIWLTYRAFETTPTGFVPAQDKQYLIAFAQLPDGASLDRTEKVIRELSDIALKHPGVDNSIAFPGLSIQGFSISPNSGIVFVGLKPFEERTTPELSAEAIAGALNGQFSQIKEALVLSLSPPPVNGIGTTGGFKLMILDRSDAGYDALYQQTQQLLGKVMQTQRFGQTYSGYTVNVPQLDADVDREKAKAAECPCRICLRPCRSILARCM